MKKNIINHWIKIIKKKKIISEEKEEIIRYGLEGIYLTLTKTIVIVILALIFNCLIETLIFTFIYGLLRTFSYGIHAKKSWMCWISSLIVFIIIPILSKSIYMNIYIRYILFIIGTILMFKNSPADTYKRPIISRKRRLRLKLISTIICLIYIIISIYINNSFIINCFIYSIILQDILISPLTYKLFNLPYNNYITYLKEHPKLNNL